MGHNAAMYRVLAVAFLAIALIVAGCGDDEPTSSAPTEPSPTTATTPTPEPEPKAKPTGVGLEWMAECLEDVESSVLLEPTPAGEAADRAALGYQTTQHLQASTTGEGSISTVEAWRASTEARATALVAQLRALDETEPPTPPATHEFGQAGTIAWVVRGNPQSLYYGPLLTCAEGTTA
ncbi:MAG: hypothetical protein JWO69_228 [Thermoleophilia bacterium]|jgi:hypothetical protein|nr:hypothetical protein [Thermoleophilia bacterium]